ncbi:hypothetical protein NADE_000254 [Nannochloris sp. 'desiccata']|nr:hypothetical protein KSW81_004963 [Chlorella desiccata (nom. nud.)]KAH7618053.1 hypothetical protein NADE_000254 [Chlorella desiccata (nom. nud.)]
MAAATKDYSKPRFWLRVVEATGVLPGGAHHRLRLFVGLTSFLLCLLFIYIAKKKSDDRGFLTIELGLTILYWIFWLSAAAASASTVNWVNSWPSFQNVDCSKATIYFGAYDGWCTAGKRKGAVRACCAFAWLTWGAWTASLVLMIIEDVMGPKKLLSSKPGAAPAGAAAAAPAEAPAPTAQNPATSTDMV